MKCRKFRKFSMKKARLYEIKTSGRRANFDTYVQSTRLSISNTYTSVSAINLLIICFSRKCFLFIPYYKFTYKFMSFSIENFQTILLNFEEAKKIRPNWFYSINLILKRWLQNEVSVLLLRNLNYSLSDCLFFLSWMQKCTQRVAFVAL